MKSTEIIRVDNILKAQHQQFLLGVAEGFTQGTVNLEPASVWRHERHSGGVIESVTKRFVRASKHSRRRRSYSRNAAM